ncbi:uncharacterized protein LOC129913745 [Episyrphus balteatus]|uniref:uncharacterized protein LOC129913745 n=1 Tax=Episyrphus balteatus TaxID=286459 RepID=UPI002486A068|nr:uncharacterized protein LOC129913745 [Episyrphus balteatus]
MYILIKLNSIFRRPGYRNRIGQQRPNRYRQPQEPKEEDEKESTGSSFMSFFQKAKTFYDIFQAMNSAWKTVEDRYRKNNPHQNQSQTQNHANHANHESVNNKMNPKRLRTTKAPIIITPSNVEEDQQQQQQQEQQDTSQEKDEYRSRRSWLKETTVNDNKESTYDNEDDDDDDDNSQITESDSSASGATSSSSSSTAVAEGRYIKGDPLKGYYDFVITEGSYKFWAVFQVGTALLIIYSTFAAIYYSKVNPLVSDYDYVDYLGGGRSLSDDSDFVDMDAPLPPSMAADSEQISSSMPEGVSRSRQQDQSTASAPGWIGWLPHAGHTLRFILESIDKVYNED